MVLCRLLLVFYLVIWRRLLVACSLRSQEKHLKIFRALRAPCFVSKFSEKTPLCGFWSDDTRIKKLFLLFFPPPLSLLARAARRNFRFFPGIFLLKRSQDEVRSVWKSSKILDFLSGRFVMLHFHYIVEKKTLNRSWAGLGTHQTGGSLPSLSELPVIKYLI